MFNVFAIIVHWWVMIGLGFFPTLVIMETLVSIARGPGYMNWVRQHREDHGRQIRLFPLLLVWMFLWPFVMYQWLRAGWNRMTLTEYSIRSEIRKSEQEQDLCRRSLEATAKLTNALGDSQGTVWLAPYIKGLLVQPYVRAVARQSALVCTHLIVVLPDDTVAAFRLGEVMEGEAHDPDLADESERDFEHPDLSVVTRWCDNDHHWNELCESGTKGQRDMYLRVLARQRPV